MRIARYVNGGESFWGVIDSETEEVRRLIGPISSWAPRVAVEDAEGLPLEDARQPVGSLRMLAPVDPSARIFGVGANYLAHLQKLGIDDRPDHPTAFMKPNSSVVADGEEIRYPPTTEQLDYEVELVAVMAGPASAPLLGFTIGNDVSARDAKGLLGYDLFSMKSLDATTPIGPWIVTPGELGAAGLSGLDIALRVNGQLRQQDNTEKMLWQVPEILEYLNKRVELRCGDVIFTGTTAGVGMEDGRFLQPGDVVEAEIEGIGVLRNAVGPKHRF